MFIVKYRESQYVTVLYANFDVLDARKLGLYHSSENKLEVTKKNKLSFLKD